MKKLLTSMILAGTACLLTACHDDSHYENHPPEGHGGLLVDNHTPENVDVFVDEHHIGVVQANHARYFEVHAGLRHIDVRPHHFYRTWHGNIDVFDHERTVIDIETCGCGNRDLDVAILRE